MIFLIGATGHVGGHVANALRGRGDVRALARSDRSARELAETGFEVVRGDIADPEPLRMKLSDFSNRVSGALRGVSSK